MTYTAFVHRADDEAPFTYSFDTIDICTRTKRVLVNPISASGSLTTDLRYDVGGVCEQEGDRLVMVAGTVTDRFGATAELCDRESKCPFVAFSPDKDVLRKFETVNYVRGVQKQLNKNQITKMQAVGELTFAVQIQNAHARVKREQMQQNQAVNDQGLREIESKRQNDLITVLDIVKGAADDALITETHKTPLLQGACNACNCMHFFTSRHIHVA